MSCKADVPSDLLIDLLIYLLGAWVDFEWVSDLGRWVSEKNPVVLTQKWFLQMAALTLHVKGH